MDKLKAIFKTDISPRRFVTIVLGIAGSLVFIISLFNYLVDPYGLFGLNRSGIYISAEREFKSAQVQRYPHDALLVGNSRMAMIPVADLTGFTFFNAALGGGNAEEIYYFLKHFAHKEKLVILGVDPGQGDPVSPKGDIFNPPDLNAVLGNLLNLKTVEYSVKTLYSRFAGLPATLRGDGSFDARPWFDRWDKPDPVHLDFVVGELRRGYLKDVNPQTVPMTFYEQIAKCMRERGITVVVVVPPVYETVAGGLRDVSMQAKYQVWRSRLQAIFPLTVDLSVGPYSARENFFKADPVHFKPEVGVQMLNAEVIPAALRAMRTKAAEAKGP